MSEQIHEPWRLAVMDLIREQAKPADKYGHQPRLYSLTRRIGAGLSYDDDVVFAAVWLHDLGVFVGHRPESPEELVRWDHVGYAVRHVPGILERAGFPVGKIPQVLDVIRTHQPHDEPNSIEATIVRDADILEQLGCIGVLRSMVKVGRDTRYALFSDVLPVLQRAVTELPGKLRLDFAKNIAEPKIAILRLFLKNLQEEAGAELY
jgi:uncharacterized protein